VRLTSAARVHATSRPKDLADVGTRHITPEAAARLESIANSRPDNAPDGFKQALLSRAGKELFDVAVPRPAPL
jgi:hypothetical protein